MDAISPARLSAFLVDAKRCTYAGLDDEATVSTPAFAGSKQLEYRDDGLSYRDIYFGMTYFVGQEVVQSGARVIWSMSYAGGLLPGIADRAEVAAIYAFLRQSLLRIEADTPFRGPLLFEEGLPLRQHARRRPLRFFRRGADHAIGCEGLRPCAMAAE